MKTKNKILVIVEIAIVLCSLFLVALPVVAADQNQEMQEVSANTVTTASEDDYVLGVYGNANEDDTIDMRDLTYVKLIFFGKKPETELSDAKYDGKINPLDFIQTKLIILGKEKELTVVDSADRIVTVTKPVERLIVCMVHQHEMMRSLKIETDRMVGVDSRVQQGDNYKIFFPEYQDKPTMTSQDPESVLTLCPDLVIVHPMSVGEYPLTHACEAAGIVVFHAWAGLRGLVIVEELEKFGYILDKKDEAAEFIDWYEGAIVNPALEKVKDIPEEDKPKVYMESGRYRVSGECNSHIAKTGGKDIFEGKSGAVDPEAVARLNSDVILLRRDIGGFGTTDTTEFKEARQELMSRPELQNVKAVKTGRVYVFSGYITGYFRQAGGRQFILDAYQAKWFHPKLFEDLDPKAIHQEYLTRFQGVDIDLDKQGVFVYHPEEHPDGN